jgi:hypothetical protein
MRIFREFFKGTCEIANDSYRIGCNVTADAEAEIMATLIQDILIWLSRIALIKSI